MSKSTPAQAQRKMCRKCLEHKPVSEFSRRNDGYGGGYVSACRPCINARRRINLSPPQVLPPGQHKMCTKCLKYKPFNDFSRRSDGYGDGYTSSCKECNNAHTRDSYWHEAERRGRPRPTYSPPPARMPAPEGHGRCSKCNQIKPISEFSRRTARASGRSSACRECLAAANRKRYVDVEFREKERVRGARFRAENPDYQRRWIEANIELRREYSRAIAARRRARKRGLPAESYTLTQLIERDGSNCVLCGQMLNMVVSVPHPRAATVEHLECISWPNSSGDVLSNVAVSHFRCNIERKDRPHPAAARKRAELMAIEERAEM